MKNEKEIKKNIEKLKAIRDDPDTAPAVRIQAIQTMQKIFESMGAIAQDSGPTAADIMKKIRGTKK